MRLPIPWIFAVFLILAGARCLTSLPWVDEGYFFDPAYNLLIHGHPGTTVMDGKGFPWEGIERYQYWQPPLRLVVDTAWLKVFGLSLVAFRSLSLVAGLCLLFCWWWLLKDFGAPRGVCLLALALIATDYTVVRAGSDGRADILAATFGLSGVACYLKLRESHFGWAVFLSQVLIVCGGLTHPMGGIPYVGMVAWFFVTGRDWRRARGYHAALAAIPYLAGVAGWGAYIMQDPVLFRKVFFGGSAAGRFDGMFHPLLALKNEIMMRYLMPFGLGATSAVLKVKIVVPLLYLCTIPALLVTPLRRETFLRPLLAMWAVTFLSLMFLDNMRSGLYLIHIIPLYAIFLASLAWWLWNQSADALRRAVVVIALAGFVMLQVGGALYLIVQNPLKRDYKQVVEFVKTRVRPGDRLVGSAELGFGLGFDNVHDDIALGYFVNRKPDIIVMASRYRWWYEVVHEREPKIYQHVMQLLDTFQLVYKSGTFEVYIPRDRAIVTPPT